MEAGSNTFYILRIDLPAPDIFFLSQCLFKRQNIRDCLFGIRFDNDPVPFYLCLHTVAPFIPLFPVFLFRDNPWQQVDGRLYRLLSAGRYASTVHIPGQLVLIPDQGNHFKTCP